VDFKEALAVCEDEEEWPEGRPGASVFSLIQEVGVMGMWEVVYNDNGRRLTTRIPQPSGPLDRAATSETHNCTHEVFAAGCVCTD
jgi:hypothetical protein